MNNIIIYTATTCPRCRVLKSKLEAKNISYVEVTDEVVMQEKNIEFVPMLEANGELMDFATANIFINNYTNG